MDIRNEKIKVVIGSVTRAKVIKTMQNAWGSEHSANIKANTKCIKDDTYETKLFDGTSIMATVTKLTESGMHHLITTFSIHFN